MDCVCGCGKDLPKNLGDRNFIAAGVALELLVWDKSRALPGRVAEGREGLIARGVDCYESLLASLHGEWSGDPDQRSDTWLRESRFMRADRSDMTKKRFLAAPTPNLSEEDMSRLNRRHPERSFTGGGEATPSEAGTVSGPRAADDAAVTPPAGAPTPSTAPRDDDLVGQLERLRTLRDDDVLTDEEFVAAKARLLERS
jgi:hypothetical protein